MLRSSVRVLGTADLEEALSVCGRDPVANVFVEARLRAHGLGRRAGGQLWGFSRGGSLSSLCWSGANLVPIQADAEAIEAFAARARRQGRQCSSIVGPASPALRLWELLSPYWGRPRDIRADQPLMQISGPPTVEPDPHVRPAVNGELDSVVSACVAMFTEEVGYSPVAMDGGSLYRSQVAALVIGDRSLVRMTDTSAGREVVFKAEIGSVAPKVAQLQGVWVNPRWRGQGLAEPGMAAVVRYTQLHLAPVVSLYVNDYNHRAIRVYERVGFERVGTFATVLF